METEGIIRFFSSSSRNFSHKAIYFLFGEIAKQIIFSKLFDSFTNDISGLSNNFIAIYFPIG
jgi:hypothetical protein